MPYKDPEARKEYHRKRPTQRKARLKKEAEERANTVRVCEHEECNVILSRYNTGTRCAIHERVHTKATKEIASFF